jgi:hypothetical protein
LQALVAPSTRGGGEAAAFAAGLPTGE